MAFIPWFSLLSSHLHFFLPLVLLVAPSLANALGGTGADPILETEIDITLHVDAAAPGPGDGTASDPFSDLQDALNRAINEHNAKNFRKEFPGHPRRISGTNFRDTQGFANFRDTQGFAEKSLTVLER